MRSRWRQRGRASRAGRQMPARLLSCSSTQGPVVLQAQARTNYKKSFNFYNRSQTLRFLVSPPIWETRPALANSPTGIPMPRHSSVCSVAGASSHQKSREGRHYHRQPRLPPNLKSFTRGCNERKAQGGHFEGALVPCGGCHAHLGSRRRHPVMRARFDISAQPLSSS